MTVMTPLLSCRLMHTFRPPNKYVTYRVLLLRTVKNGGFCKNTCAEWVEKLKAVRRALRENSFGSRHPAEERGTGRDGRPAGGPSQ